jgi:hypothetical protein
MDPRYPIDEQWRSVRDTPLPAAGDGIDAEEGRITRGMRLSGLAWRVLRERRSLWILPAISTVATAIAAVAIFLPVLDATRTEASRVSMFAAMAAAALPLSLISTFFNVGFLHVVAAHLDGRELSAWDGLRHARSRLGAIVAWSLLSTLVGVLFRALEVVRGGELVGRLLSALGGLAWALATFFVVPALALEPIGVRQALRRSTTTFRKRWGEQVSGEIVIGAGFGLAAIPGVVAATAAFVAIDRGDTVNGSIGVVVAAVLLTPVLVASAAMTEMFALIVYRHAKGGGLPAPFTAADLDAGLKRRKPGILSRLRRSA